MSARATLLRRIAAEIRSLAGAGVTFVGIDGVDGAGKTWFANELAAFFDDLEVIRASVDGFHNPRAVRYALGKDSPEGFFRDSFDYGALRSHLLDPLRPGGSLRYRTAAFDHRTDQPVESPLRTAHPPAVLIVDGIFLHRPELAGYWHWSAFLEVERRVSLQRCNQRDGQPDAPDDPSHPMHRRYVVGQEIYLRSCRPETRATMVIDNNDLSRPWRARNFSSSSSH